MAESTERVVVATHNLTKSVRAHGEDTAKLEFRAPTGADMLDIGNPVVVDMSRNPPVITHDVKVMGQMIARLASVPFGTVREMQPADIAACSWLLTDFFVPAL